MKRWSLDARSEGQSSHLAYESTRKKGRTNRSINVPGGIAQFARVECPLIFPLLVKSSRVYRFVLFCHARSFARRISRITRTMGSPCRTADACNASANSVSSNVRRKLLAICVSSPSSSGRRNDIHNGKKTLQQIAVSIQLTDPPSETEPRNSTR